MNDLSELLHECAPLASAKSPKYEALAKARELKDLGFDKIADQMRDKVLLAEKMECIARERYLVITPAKIKNFLSRKAARYNEEVVKKHGPRPEHQAAANMRVVKAAIRAAETGDHVDAIDYALGQAFDNNNQTTSTSNAWTFTVNPQWGSTTWGSIVKEDTNQFYSLTNDFLSPVKERIAGFLWNEVRVKDYDAVPPPHALQALKEAKSKEIFHDFTIASVTHVEDPLLLGRLNGSDDRFFIAQWGDDIALDDVA